MDLDADACYRALASRDRRWDGVFYVGVTTTGVYCRPICPARTPGRARCEFFSRAVLAEHAGYRACFRCRPELAPGLASVDATPRLVHAAAQRIDAGFLNAHSIEGLAGALGVTSRHLRRAMETELGVSPVELAQSRRLALAKQLLQDTGLPLAEIAFASGFASVRRFNAVFRAQFGRAPSTLRREHAEPGPCEEMIELRLGYRPPFDFAALLAFLSVRAVPGVESVEGGEYRREVALGGRRGTLIVRDDPTRHALVCRVSPSLAPSLMEIAARVRALFDLDARPTVVAAHLARDPRLARLVKARPGLRVPGAFDGFEVAIRAILGQQISVRGATTLAGRLAERFGAPFTAPTLAAAPLAAVRAIGLPAARAQTIVSLSRAVADGTIDLSPGAGSDPASTIAALERISGIGPWTAQYLAMLALRWPDAFPAGDLGVRKALGVERARDAETRAAAWRPWRAYAVIHLWTELGG
jgi:AraC family transcriptional regulator of adaptative response / DNA-3-methyladenine glycosylase II